MPRTALLLILLTALFAGPAYAAVPMTWQVERHIDATTGLRSCLVRSLGSHVTAILEETASAQSPAWSVRIGFDNHPGSLRYLRINRKIFQTMSERFRDAEAQEIVNRLKAPGEFVFEWALGPNSEKQGGLFLTGNFVDRAADCEDWFAHTRASLNEPAKSTI